MAFMLWLLLTLQVWTGVSDDSSSAALEAPAASAGALSPGDLVPPGVDAQSVTDFFNNMSRSTETFDQVSYHRGPVVLRGVLNNQVCEAIPKALPSQMTDCFRHHWLEFHVANPNLSARTLVHNTTELQVVKLHFMDNGFLWRFGNGSAPQTEVARSKQVIDPMEVVALVQDPQPVWRPLSNNCQDVSFQQWNFFVTDSNAVPTPLVTKITAFVMDSAALVAIILLICTRKTCFKRNQQNQQILIQEPLLQQ